MKYKNSDTIAAVATGRGGAIAIVRVSGGDAVAVVDKIFASRSGVSLTSAAGYTVHFGEIRAGGEGSGGSGSTGGRQKQVGESLAKCSLGAVGKPGGEVVDEVLVTVFRAPHSYTGEDSVEISCHASPYVEGRIMELLLVAGARAASPGEFTMRAFLAGRLDLSQAEAVADLIASTDRAGHSLAMGQMRGGVSSALATLREELVALSALLELELDFGEEQVEFASRERLAELAGRIATEVDRLAGSFSLGNAIREGVPVAIVGRPNVGKSTLLNALAGDDRAMVSDIAGTTRDRIEERVNIGGVGFRLIDTAGLRETDDVLEQMGIDRALDAVRSAYAVLLVVDGEGCAGGGDGASAGAGVGAGAGAGVGSGANSASALMQDISEQIAALELRPEQKLCVVVNKIDRASNGAVLSLASGGYDVLALSAKTGAGLDGLRDLLLRSVDVDALEAGSDSAVVSSARHHEALIRSAEALKRVLRGLKSDGLAALPADLLAEDIREVLHHLGTITGEITTDEVLGTIFSKFCIGK